MDRIANVAIEGLWQAFHSRLRQFIRARVSDDDVADDILQNVFIRIHARLHTLRDETKLESWMYQITRNAIADYYRSLKPTAAWDEALGQFEPEADDEEDAARLLAPGLKGMVNLLPPVYAEAIRLTEFEGLTQKQLALRLGLSISGAKSRVQRGRALLKQMLLDCCHFELDRRGGVIDYYPRRDCAGPCGCDLPASFSEFDRLSK